MKHLPQLLLAALLALPVSPHAAAEESKLSVFVPVAPYEWLFERIGGDWIVVEAIVGESDDPHEYSPSPRQLARIAQANLLFSGELAFEGNFFVKIGDGKNAPRQFDLLEGLDLLEGGCSICEDEAHGEHEGHEEHEEHAHGHDHDHAELKDPHVWLSPRMLQQQAGRIADILKAHTPDEANVEIEANLAQLREELNAIDAELRDLLASHEGETFYVYHGAFAYFAESYGLEQKAIEVNGRRPTPRQLAEIADQARKEGVKLIFVQPQFDQSSAVSLAETINGEVARLDPLEADVIANLRNIAEAIRSRRG